MREIQNLRFWCGKRSDQKNQQKHHPHVRLTWTKFIYYWSLFINTGADDCLVTYILFVKSKEGDHNTWPWLILGEYIQI